MLTVIWKNILTAILLTLQIVCTVRNKKVLVCKTQRRSQRSNSSILWINRAMSLEIDKIKRFNCILCYNFYLNLIAGMYPFMYPMYSALPLPTAHQKILNLTLNPWESINSRAPIVSLCSVICYIANPWRSFCLIRHSWSTKHCKWNPKNNKGQHKLYKGIWHICFCE